MADEILLELLHSELVSYVSQTEVKEHGNKHGNLSTLEYFGFNTGFRIIERLTKDSSRFTNELDTVKFICTEFWSAIYKKPIDNLRTNHQGVYVLQDNAFRFMSKISSSIQYLDVAPLRLENAQLGETSNKIYDGFNDTKKKPIPIILRLHKTVCWNLLQKKESYLSYHQQAALLNGTLSDFAGVSVGSILRPILFLIHINDLLFQNIVLECLQMTPMLSLAHFSMEMVKYGNQVMQVERRNWFISNRLSSIELKTATMVFSDKPVIDTQYTNEYIAFTSGLLRGALANLGINSIVTAEVQTMPTCRFHIQVNRN